MNNSKNNSILGFHAQLSPFQWTLLLLSIKISVFLISYFWLLSKNISPNLCGWDCGYYQSIAKDGYALTLGKEHSNLAFFPAFPYITKLLLGWTGLDFAWQGVLLNLGLFGFGIYLMLLWSQELKIGPNYFLPALLYTLDRFTLWSHVPYTESLFFVSILSVFVILRRRTFGTWSTAIAALIGGFSSAIRIVGVSVIAGLGIARFKYYLRNPAKGIVYLILGCSGVILFFSYLHFSRGAWDLSLNATKNWHREFSILGLFKSLWLLLKHFYFPTILILVFGFYALFSKRIPIKFSKEEKLICGFLLFIPLASTVQISLTRYMTMFIIAYPVWAYFISKYDSKIMKFIWILILAAEFYWQIILTMKFFNSEVFLWAA